MSIITLTTDFGTRDWFVGTMKGVILGIHPDARIVDLTHDIPAGDIRAGAFALAAGYPHFPSGTIHVAIVDPGVGSPRPAVAVRTRRFTFIGPDNGVLSLALDTESIRAVRRIENPKLFLDPVSQTFHGRDVFAPVAAHLAKGTRFDEVGPRGKEVFAFDRPKPSIDGAGIRGEILYIDHFGNAITNIPGTCLPTNVDLQVRLQAGKHCPVKPFYAAVPPGKPVALVGSTGLLEIAINGGSARQQLKLCPGDEVRVQPESSHRPKAFP